jgi:hypothetical protein
MKNIAAENNLAEATFYVKENGGFRIRWFSPGMEIDLCGHATLVAAHVLFSHEGYRGNPLSFASWSGERGEGTLCFSAFIFNVLGSVGRDGAPNFPPHDWVTFGVRPPG